MAIPELRAKPRIAIATASPTVGINTFTLPVAIAHPDAEQMTMSPTNGPTRARIPRPSAVAPRYPIDIIEGERDVSCENPPMSALCTDDFVEFHRPRSQSCKGWRSEKTREVCGDSLPIRRGPRDGRLIRSVPMPGPSAVPVVDEPKDMCLVLRRMVESIEGGIEPRIHAVNDPAKISCHLRERTRDVMTTQLSEPFMEPDVEAKGLVERQLRDLDDTRDDCVVRLAEQQESRDPSFRRFHELGGCMEMVRHFHVSGLS
ncbi:MAG: hypothetical protein M3P11_06905 [Actinomycetota bacterium]|nr:hypothetical protein [Actinomycetota bacterium]